MTDTSYSAQFPGIRAAWDELADALTRPEWLAIVGMRLDDLTEAAFFAGCGGFPENAWIVLDADGRIESAALSDGLSRRNDPLDDTWLVFGDIDEQGKICNLQCCDWDAFSGGVPVAAMRRRDAIALYGSENDEDDDDPDEVD